MTTSTQGEQLGVDAHYQQHADADSYDSAFFYEPGAYTAHLADLVVDRLKLNDDSLLSTTTRPGSSDRQQGRRLLDIGGGTGSFTRMLIEGGGRQNDVEAVVIDPFLAKDQSHDSSSLRFVQAPAEAFLDNISTSSSSKGQDNVDNDEWWKRDYHQVLMKEIVHHLPKEKRVDIFQALHKGLLPLEATGSSSPIASASSAGHDDLKSSNGGAPSILIITRPQHEIDYPLWPEAREVWAQNQPSSEQIEEELHMAGFSHLSTTMEAYPCVVDVKKWQGMVRSRFWSTFASFTDEELDRACEHIEQSELHCIDDRGQIHFEDRLLFITGCK